MDMHDARRLRAGSMIYPKGKYNADGTAMRARVTSVKTWKTRPTEIQIGYKHGMYDTGYLNQHDLANFTTKEPAPRKKAVKKLVSGKALRTPRPYYPQYGIR